MAIQINGTSGVSGVDGSATTPALQGTDTNTGLTFGTDTVGVVTGGTTRTTVDSSGRLLVGTSSARTVDFWDTPRQQFEGLGQPAASLLLFNNENLVWGPALALGKSRGTSIGSNTIVQSGDYLGTIAFMGSDGTDETQGAEISAYVDGTPGANDMPSRLVFSTTADGASSPTERMRITQAGRVGINCTPAVYSQFQVNGNSDTGFPLTLHDTKTGTTNATIVYFLRNNASPGSISTTNTATSYNTSSDYRLKENITAVTDGITRLQQLKPSRFNFIADPDKTVDGFIAHEVQAVVPEAINGEKDATETVSAVLSAGGSILQQNVTEADWEAGKIPDQDGNTVYPANSQWVAEHEAPVYQGIDQSKLVPLLTAALQEAIGKIEALETRVAQLEGGTN